MAAELRNGSGKHDRVRRIRAARKKATANNIWWLISVCMAEVIGTGMLVFFGCIGGVPSILEEEPSLLQKCIVFGLAVATIIQVFGHISGAHLNPAVTLSAWVWKAVSLPTAGLYILAQFIGGVLGYSTILIMTPTELLFPPNSSDFNGTHGFCTTVPNGKISTIEALLAEYLATSILILLCCGIWDKRNASRQDSVALKFGFTIAALGMAIGPYTGCSMNPARSFAPALFTGEWDRHWIYWVGPLSSGIFVTYFYKFVFDRESDSTEKDQSDVPLNQTNSKIQNIEKTSTEALATV